MDEINKIALGQRIKQIRLRRGMTLEEFGELLKAADSIVSRWENGISIPRPDRLKKIAKLENITVEELLYPNEIVQELINENASLRDEKRRLTAEAEDYLYSKTAKSNMFDVLLAKGIITQKQVSEHMYELDKRDRYEIRKLWSKGEANGTKKDV